MDFERLVTSTREQRNLSNISGLERLIAFDPGHTTGWAYFQGLELMQSGEIDTREIEASVNSINGLLRQFGPETIVLEDYRVYKWRAKHHAGSNLLTARVIGRIEALGSIDLITDIYKQPAHIAKGFCTNSKLKNWGFYQSRGVQKHANDAIRHACYFLLFGPIQLKDREQVGTTVG